MYGITFNDAHSWKDKKVAIGQGKDIGFPIKEKKKYKPPYSNKDYDFSELYGRQTFEYRYLTYPFNIIGQNKEEMNIQVTMIINWLMGSVGKKPLYDDTIPGYYFLAEVESHTFFAEQWRDGGVLTVTFEAYPFKIKSVAEGSPYWDDYSILDVYQETKFTISGSRQITLYNVGQPDYMPRIIASSQMQIQFEGNTFTVPSGMSESYDLMLSPGENQLMINGNGTIEFVFHQEVI